MTIHWWVQVIELHFTYSMHKVEQSKDFLNQEDFDKKIPVNHKICGDFLNFIWFPAKIICFSVFFSGYKLLNNKLETYTYLVTDSMVHT